jgi:hypothetical protein
LKFLKRLFGYCRKKDTVDEFIVKHKTTKARTYKEMKKVRDDLVRARRKKGIL